MIGKTRRTPEEPPRRTPESPPRATLDEPPRGVLHRLPPDEFAHWRSPPPPELEPWVEHWWSVRWNLEGRPPRVQETLPHPTVHLVSEPGLAAVWGVQTRRFARTLAGRGSAFGVKFRVGAFRGFLGAPVASLLDRHVPVEALFPEDAAALRALADGDGAPEDEAVAVATRALRRRLPAPSAQAGLAREIVALAGRDRTLNDVAALARASGLAVRSLQRLFAEQVGVSPKWVLRRHRLHEAVARAQGGEALDWAALAQELGYFDQAHLIADFRALVGWTPASYARRYPDGTAPDTPSGFTA
jgi:AraC-like DNA-binding protein